MFRRNIIANFFGRAWPSLLSFLFVPVYIKYLGVEAYGLIGFFTSLQAILVFLDLGLSTTANREMAMRRENPALVEETRNIVRTLEIVYGLVALFIALLFLFSATWLATNWINAEGLSQETIRYGVIIFGVTLALRWPVSLYSGVLFGLERQVLLNVLVATTSTVRIVGAVIAVVYFSPTILVFLFWQLGSALLEFLVMIYVTWYVLPRNQYKKWAGFDLNLLKGFWRFSVSVSANSIIATVLKQTDRILLSGLVPLQSLGYYSTAYSAYSGLGLLQVPVSDASFPRFSSLVSQHKTDELADIYHRASQYLSFMIVPVASFVFYFSHDLLLLWTQSIEVAQNAAFPLSLLALAYCFNSMMQLPWRLQLAYGITRIMLIFNSAAVIILFPIMFFLIRSYGIQGAGIGWVVFNLGYYLIIPHWMHKTILPSHKWRWYFYDTFLIIVFGWLLFGIAFVVQYVWHIIGLTLLVLLLAGSAYIFLCYSLYPAIRYSIQDLVVTFSKQFKSFFSRPPSAKSD